MARILSNVFNKKIELFSTNFCRLSNARKGSVCVLVAAQLPEEQIKRLAEAGIVPGTAVTVGVSASAGDPTLYKTDEVRIALRKETADRLLVREIRK